MDKIRLDSIMSPDVISVTPETPLSEALSILSEKKISCLLVAENNKPIGILTERDLVKIAGGSTNMLKKKLPEVMKSPVITVPSGMDILDGYAVLREAKIRHLVVVDEQGGIEGIVTHTNLLEELGTKLTDDRPVFDVMTRVIVISKPDDTVHQISRKMTENSTSCIIIEDNSKPLGIITERDIAKILLSGVDVSAESVNNWMSSPVHRISSKMPMPEAMHLMNQKKHRRLIVHDDNGKTVGLVTQSDLVRGMLEGNYLRGLRASLERKELALSESEKRYKQLFTNMLNGFALHEVVVNEDNKPIDYIFLEVNDAFEIMTGLKRSEIIGKKVTEALPGIENDPANWISVYGKVALTGEESRFEQYVQPLRKWYSVYAYKPRENQFAAIFYDITERKQLELKLKISEKKDRVWLENSPVCTKIVDLDFNLQYMSVAGIKALKVDDVSQLYGTPYPFNFFPKSTKKSMAEILEKVKKTGEIITAEAPVADIDGNEMWFQATFVPIKDNEGRIESILVVSVDINERKKAEEELKASHERFTTIMNAIDAIVYVADMETYDLLFLNKYAKKLFGDVVGKKCWQALQKGQSGQCDFCSNDKLIPPKGKLGETFTWEFQNTITDRWFHIHDRAISWVDGRIVRLEIASDITGRKKAENMLKLKAEQQLASNRLGLIALSGMGLDEIFQAAVASISKTLGLEYTKILELLPDGKSFLLREGVGWKEGIIGHATVGTELDSQAGYALKSKQPVIVKDLREEPRFSGTPLLRDHGVISGMSVIIQGKDRPFGILGAHTTRQKTFTEDDINFLQSIANVLAETIARKQAEEESKIMEEKLRHTQKLESLGVLAGGIAHDFNNILTSILGNTDLALDDLSPASTARDYIEEIHKGAKRAAELSQQMLAYSGKGKFIIKNIDVNDIIKEMTHMLEVSISKKHNIKYDLTENLLLVEVDITQIHQVIMNLIINASEAIGENNGVISVSTSTVECGGEECQTCRDMMFDEVLPMGQYVVTEVADTGIGMDEEIIKKIFDPFFTTKLTGRGLGMSVVLGIIRGHKGAINVESEPGVGTKFTVFLPVSGNVLATTKPGREETAASWRGHGTVLLVDDDETVREVGKDMLEAIGFNVTTAVDGQEAVQIFHDSSNEIDCVLLDLTMPLMNGEECFHELRKIWKDIRVVIYSGYSKEETAQKFVDQGVNEFLQKPFGLKALKNTMRKVFVEDKI